MSKTLEEVVVVGVIALIALSILTNAATTSAQIAQQNSTAGQVATYAGIAQSFIQEI